MPHDLLVAKLEAYGHIISYLSNKQQRVRVGEKYCSWQTTNKGVPQGSVLGPRCFSMFLLMISFILSKLLTNYADDNTLSYANKNFQIVKLNNTWKWKQKNVSGCLP